MRPTACPNVAGQLAGSTALLSGLESIWRPALLRWARGFCESLALTMRGRNLATFALGAWSLSLALTTPGRDTLPLLRWAQSLWRAGPYYAGPPRTDGLTPRHGAESRVARALWRGPERLPVTKPYCAGRVVTVSLALTTPGQDLAAFGARVRVGAQDVGSGRLMHVNGAGRRSHMGARLRATQYPLGERCEEVEMTIRETHRCVPRARLTAGGRVKGLARPTKRG